MTLEDTIKQIGFIASALISDGKLYSSYTGDEDDLAPTAFENAATLIAAENHLAGVSPE